MRVQYVVLGLFVSEINKKEEKGRKRAKKNVAVAIQARLLTGKYTNYSALCFKYIWKRDIITDCNIDKIL